MQSSPPDLSDLLIRPRRRDSLAWSAIARPSATWSTMRGFGKRICPRPRAMTADSVCWTLPPDQSDYPRRCHSTVGNGRALAGGADRAHCANLAATEGA